MASGWISKVPSFKLFMMRREVLSFYRGIVRSTRGVEPSQRESTLAFAREQIRMMKDVDDSHHIRYLLMEGKQQVEQFKEILLRTKT